MEGLALTAIILTLMLITKLIELLIPKPRPSNPLVTHEYITEKTLESYRTLKFIQRKSEYLSSRLFREKSALVLRRDGLKCTSFSTTKNLEVHFDAGYNLIPHEPIECLRTLCESCHKSFHKTYGYPHSIQDFTSWDTRNVTFKC